MIPFSYSCQVELILLLRLRRLCLVSSSHSFTAGYALSLLCFLRLTRLFGVMATDSFDLGALNFSQKDAYSVKNSRPVLSSRNSGASSIRSTGTGGQDRHDVVSFANPQFLSRCRDGD